MPQPAAKGRNHGLLAVFAHRVRVARNRKKWTLADLARASEVSRSFVWKIEQQDANVSLSVAASLAQALDTNVSWLLAEQALEPPPLLTDVLEAFDVMAVRVAALRDEC